MIRQNVIDNMLALLIDKVGGERVAIAILWIVSLVFLGVSVYDGITLAINGELGRLAFLGASALQFAGAAILILYSFEPVKMKLKKPTMDVWGQHEGTCITVSNARSIVVRTFNERLSLIMLAVGFALPLASPTTGGISEVSQLVLWVSLLATAIALSQAIACTAAVYYTKGAIDGIIYFED